MDHRDKNIEWSTELVQHSAQRGNSHRHNVATGHTVDIVWLYRSPLSGAGEGWGLLLALFAHGDYYLPGEGKVQ